jgi:hypothetical protein
LRYSQPYGTPQPPLGQYPRYINGNPVTGTEGSIPPATAFDEAQVEIVTVIANAGLVPTHSDLTQLWQALMALFSQRYITTPVIKSVHGVGADFTDLVAGMNWLAQFVITPTGSVTFICAPGKWTYTQAVELNHPNMDRVTIQGSALLAPTPAPNNFSVTGYHVAADGNAHIIYLRTIHATELAFTGGVNGFVVYNLGCTLRYLLITGSQTVAPGPGGGNEGPLQGNGILMYADVSVDGVSIWGFGSCGIITKQNTLRMITSLSFVVSYCGWQGLLVQGGNFFAQFNSAVILVSNGIDGINCNGGLMRMFIVDTRGHGPPNGNAGIQVIEGGLVEMTAGSRVANNYAGVVVAGCASFFGQGSLYQNNNQFGVFGYGNCAIYVNNSTFSGNTQSMTLQEAAFADCTGAAMAPLPQPPFNVYNTRADAFCMA